MTGRVADQRIEYPVNLQAWQDLTFLHWPVEPAAVQTLLPDGLVVDTHEEQAWVGVTPFRMRHVRAPGLPTVPGLDAFGEINVRTYVRRPDGATGIWFFSLDCARLAVVAALRTLGLPYFWADVRADRAPGEVTYRARRRRSRAGMRATVQVGEPLPDHDALTTFLTGRWAAYTRRGGRLWRVPIEHEPWPLRRATAGADVADLLQAAGVPETAGEPLAHFSPGVHVRIGAPRPA